MDLKEKLWYFDSAIPKETCQEIITFGESKLKEHYEKGYSTTAVTFGRNEKRESRVNPYNEKTEQEILDEGENVDDYYIRDSDICWLDEQWIYDIINPFIKNANLAAGWKWDIDGTEQVQFTKYKNSGFYGWHNDGASDHHAKYKRYIHGVTGLPLTKDGDMPMTYTRSESYIGKVRKMSVTINLSDSDSYEGGDFKIDITDLVHNRKEFLFASPKEFRNQGTVICFPSYTSHCVTPVTKGTRYSLVVWCLGAPWK